jgi:hypothetical protein
MTPEELHKEIIEDWHTATKSLDRLSKDYDKLRRRGNVNKESSYFKAYEIKTAKKNNWIFFLNKAPSENTYKGRESINVCSIIYYYNSTGLRVFKIMPSHNGAGVIGLSVYNGHLFKRYNERMSLKLSTPLDIVKTFFINNSYSQGQVIERDNKKFTLSVCKEGLMLGEIQNNGKWLVNKTFLSRDLIGIDQEEIEVDLLKSLYSQIEEELNKKDFDKNSYNYKADIIKGIK